MIAVIEVGLKLDTLMATIERRAIAPDQRSLENFARVVTAQVGELAASLEQFDMIARTSLSFIEITETD